MRTTDQQFQLLLKDPTGTHDQEINNGEVSNSVKTMMKRYPGLYNFIKKTIGPSHSPGNCYNLKKHISKLFGDKLGDKVVLNLGSGTNRIHPEIINVDLFPFKGVDIVADICALPFKDSSIDGVICEDVLEHISHTNRLLKEMSRVIKPGGTVILKIPFLYPYHSSPEDFFRWTKDGMKHTLKEYNFSVKEFGIHGGPMGALQGILMHVFAIPFSFGSKTAYFFLTQFFMVLFSPLKLLDPLFMLSPFSIDIASDIYIVAQKD